MKLNPKGDSILNDSEIKIFDYAEKKYSDNSNLVYVFADRATCGYCQDVVRRIRKGKLFMNNQLKSLYNSDIIPAKFNLGDVIGQPLYAREYFNSDKVLKLEELFKGQRSCP